MQKPRRRVIVMMALVLVIGALLASRPAQFLIMALQYETELADSTPEDTTVTDLTLSVDSTGREATLLSAFFGLDSGLPRFARLGICEGAGGKDGMPVIFSHEVDLESLQTGDFEVRSESGKLGEITCVTLAPADDQGEWRTVLVVGEYGSSADQPAKVRIVGNLLSKDQSVNFRGREVGVVRLEDGPSIALVNAVPESDWQLGKSATRFRWGGGSACPVGTRQVIRVTWQGGVTLPGGDEVDDSIRDAYTVRVEDADGAERDIKPFALGDMGDSDNNHLLCLDEVSPAIAVHFPAGLVTDPNEDLNPETSQAVER